MPLPWNPNSPAKLGLEHENVGYAAARVGGPGEWVALKFTALASDPLSSIWLHSDAGAAAPTLPLVPHNMGAGLRAPICVDVYQSGDEIQGDITYSVHNPTVLETAGTILDETLSAPEIGDVQDHADGLFLLSPNTISTAQFGFNTVTGVGDGQQIIDLRMRIWNRKSARIYRIDDKAVVPAWGTYFYVDRTDSTAYTQSDIANGDGLVDWSSPTQWSRWTPATVREFADAGKRRWRWRPLTASQGRMDQIQLLVGTCLDRRIGHGIAQAPDTPYTWFEVPIWLTTAAGSGAGPTLVSGQEYVIIIRRMNPYVPIDAQTVTAPLRFIRHPDPPANFRLFKVNTEKWQSPGRTVTHYKSVGLGEQVHGLLAAALTKDTAGTLGDHTQPYTLSRPVGVYAGQDAVQYFTTPGTPGTHGMVYVTVSTANNPTAALAVQVERVSDGVVVLGPATLAVEAAKRATALHDPTGESGRVFRRAQVQFPATFAFAATTRYRIRFYSSAPAGRRWWIGALSFGVAAEPWGLAALSAGGADEGQGQITAAGIDSTLGSDNLLTVHHSTVDDSSPMETPTGWQEGASTQIGRAPTPVLNGSWSLTLRRLSTTGDAMAWHHDLSPPYLAAAGQVFAAAASYRARTTGRQVRVDLQWLDAANAVLSTTTGTSALDSTGAWTQVTVTGTAPASTARVRVRYVAIAAVAGEDHYVDQMGLWTGAVVPAWTLGANTRGDLQAVVATLPTGPGTVTATVKQYDISPPDCLGHNHLQVEIVAGAFSDATTPDVAALDLTGNLALAWYGALDHYRGEDQIVGGKYAAGQRSYALGFTADGHLALWYSTNGVTERVLTSTVPHNFVDGAPWAIAVEFTANVLGVLHQALFYVSYDKGTTWTPLGAPANLNGVVTLFSGTALVAVGQAGDATRPAPGRHYWFRIYNGNLATGTQVANPIFTNKTVGQTALGADAAGRVWTADAGAIQAPNVNCCCDDPSRISDVPHVQLTWTATAHSFSFLRYVIQRNDDGQWRDVAYVIRESVVVWNDWSMRLGKQACYRMRAELANGQVTAWQPATGLGMTCATVPVPPAGLYLTSDVAPTYNTGYVDVYDNEAERVWEFLEYGDVEIHANHGVDKQAALHPTERRGDRFTRDVILAAICEDDRYATDNPTGAPPLSITQQLRDLTWADLPYVVVRDHQGGRWYANVKVPSVSVTEPHDAWQASLEVVEVGDGGPEPVTVA
jgi:hypothetical protein